MSKNSNLIPILIVDKNNKRATVGRKTINAPTDSKPISVKPVLVTEVKLMDQLSDEPGTAGKKLRVALLKKSSKVTPHMLAKMFGELQPGTIEALDRIITECKTGWRVVQNESLLAAKKRSFANLNNLALFIDEFTPDNMSLMNYYIIRLHAHLHEKTLVVDYSRESAEVQESARAVLRAALEFDKNASIEREEFLAGIFKDIDEITSSFTKEEIKTASNEELKTIAETISTYPEFKDVLNAAARSHSFSWTTMASLAVVYDPEYMAEPQPLRCMHLLKHAMRESYKHIKGDIAFGQLPEKGWDLVSENQAIQTQAKRYVSVRYVLSKAKVSPSKELTSRLLDNNRTDHDQIIAILHANPNVTIEQIDFILEGGTSSLSGGIL